MDYKSARECHVINGHADDEYTKFIFINSIEINTLKLAIFLYLYFS